VAPCNQIFWLWTVSVVLRNNISLIFFQAQELKIKKQFHDTVKIQYRQYKAYQKQVLQTAPKENHKELIETFKEDRNRKMADLKLQYDQSIYDMLQRQAVSVQFDRTLLFNKANVKI
jgi:NhaP-type Na+/H+ and K+/H+ antiporter